MNKPARILLVDDDPAALRLFSEILSAAAYEVCQAGTGRAALELVRTQRPNLVLLDVVLPDLSGSEVCRQIKSDGAPDVAVILFSGQATDATDKVGGLAAGADDYIVKPVSSEELLTRIRRSLQLHSTTAALRASEERFRQLAENIREVFWMTDVAKTEMLYISPGYEEIWGRTRESLQASPRTWMDAVHPDDRQRVLEAALTKQATGQYNEVYRVLRPDGAIRWIQDRAFPVKNEAGEVCRLVGIAEDISERKRAEEQVSLLADAMQSSQELISISDIEHRFTFVNRAFLQAYGYAADEVLGQTPHLLLSPRNPAGTCEQVLQQTLAGGWRGELVNRRKDGSEFPVSLSTSQIKDQFGNTLGLIGVARDISERCRTERQRAAFAQLGHRLSGAIAAEEAARIILETAAELFAWDAGYVHMYSPGEDKIIPLLTMDSVQGKRTVIQPASFTLDPSPLMRRVMKKGAVLVNRLEESSRPPQLVPFGDTSQPSACMMYVPICWNKVSVGVLSIQSYTPHAYAEPDLKLLRALADHCGNSLRRIEMAEALAKAEGGYHSIFENATEGIVRSTPEGRILVANPALARMFGFASPAEMIAQVTDIGRQLYVHPERRQELKRLLETQGLVREFQAENYRRDGSRFWISLNLRVVRDAAGAVLYYEGTNQDITHRKRAELELRQAARRIIEAQEAERLRVARELHDGVNQTLASTRMSLSKVASVLGGGSPAAKEILRRCDRLLVQVLEDNRRISHNLRPRELDDFGLAVACRNLCKQIRQRSRLTVNCSIARFERDLPSAVELNLFRIVQEALTNVEKHARAKTAWLRIYLAKDNLVLRVRDDGRGLLTDARRARKAKQLGFGLLNIRERAASLEAACEIESVPKQGTTITVRMPFKPGK